MRPTQHPETDGTGAKVGPKILPLRDFRRAECRVIIARLLTDPKCKVERVKSGDKRGSQARSRGDDRLWMRKRARMLLGS